MNLNQGFPQFNTPVVDPKTGLINQPWAQLFVTLWNRTGGAVGTSLDDALIQSDMSDADIDPVALDQATLKALMLADDGSDSANKNGSSLELTDGTTDLTGVTKITAVYLTVGGTADNATLTANGMLPLVTGDTPGPVLIADGVGQCIGVPL